MATKSAGKLSFILLVIVFVLPVIMAKFALENDWFNKASTNRGELLDPIIEAQELLQDAEQKWHLLYIIPQTCDLACENAIYSTIQVQQAIGRESDRVNAMFIATEQSDSLALQEIADTSATQVLQQSQENVNKVFKTDSVNAIFIADTLNNIVLKYPIIEDKEQAIMDSRDILADIKKLLKLSRIG